MFPSKATYPGFRKGIIALAAVTLVLMGAMSSLQAENPGKTGGGNKPIVVVEPETGPVFFTVRPIKPVRNPAGGTITSRHLKMLESARKASRYSKYKVSDKTKSSTTSATRSGKRLFLKR